MKKFKQPCWVRTQDTKKGISKLKKILDDNNIYLSNHDLSPKDSHGVFLIDGDRIITYAEHYSTSTDAIKEVYPELELPSDCKFTAGQQVLVRSNIACKWRFNIFSYYEDGGSFPYNCVDGGHAQCIDYNTNKELINTKKNE